MHLSDFILDSHGGGAKAMAYADQVIMGLLQLELFDDLQGIHDVIEPGVWRSLY